MKSLKSPKWDGCLGSLADSEHLHASFFDMPEWFMDVKKLEELWKTCQLGWLFCRHLWQPKSCSKTWSLGSIWGWRAALMTNLSRWINRSSNIAGRLRQTECATSRFSIIFQTHFISVYHIFSHVFPNLEGSKGLFPSHKNGGHFPLQDWSRELWEYALENGPCNQCVATCLSIAWLTLVSVES